MNRPKLGVIQALSLGFETIIRAAWIILIPVALDMYFWLGPRLSIYPLVERLIVSLSRTGSLGPEFQQNLDDVRRYLSDVGNSFNLFSLLATDFIGMRILPVPTLKAFEWTSESSAAYTVGSRVILLDHLPSVLLLALGLLALGLLIGVFYLTLIADRVRAAEHLKSFPRRVLKNWSRLLLFIAILFGFYLLMSIPFMLVVSLASLIHYSVALLLMTVGWLLSFWLLVYLLFVSYAIVIGNDNVLRAMWNSANIVQRNLLSTLGLVLLSNIIMAGLLLIWQSFEVTWLGSLVAIAANAFVGSGLVAAMFVFYQDRYRAWREYLSSRHWQVAGRNA